MMIYHLTLPTDQDAETFVRFIEAEYFPAVHKGATRIGQVTELELLQGNTTSITHEFYLQVTGLMAGQAPRLKDAAVQQKFESFGVRLEPVGEYAPVALWRKDANS